MSEDKYTFKLGESARKYAEEYFGETDETREKSIDEIRQWLLTEESQLNARTDDLSILLFLRGCKFKIDKTKTKLQNYYTVRGEVSAWFKNRDPLLPEIRDLLTIGVFVPLRKLHDNKLVVIIRTGAHNPKRHKQDDVFKTGMMLLDIAMKESEMASIYGVIAIFDMTGVSLSHARQLPPGLVHKAVHTWQNYHCKPKNLEFINAPAYINVVLKVFKMFMTEKMKSRIGIHFGDIEALYKIVSKDVLPKEYGGYEDNMEEIIHHWHTKALTYRSWFNNDEQYRAVPRDTNS